MVVWTDQKVGSARLQAAGFIRPPAFEVGAGPASHFAEGAGKVVGVTGALDVHIPGGHQLRSGVGGVAPPQALE